ncbi:MAG: GNAT family N-acetyltransferase [Candidatus Diapherotrites archaeon]
MNKSATRRRIQIRRRKGGPIRAFPSVFTGRGRKRLLARLPNGRLSHMEFQLFTQTGGRLLWLLAGPLKRGFEPELNKDYMSPNVLGGKYGTAEMFFDKELPFGKNNIIDIRAPKVKVAYMNREVPEKYRKKGVGTDMLKLGEKIAHRYGAKEIRAQTSTDNKNAIRSYEVANWRRGHDSGGIVTYFMKLDKARKF